MRAIKIICGGIGFLVFTICCILLVNISDWGFLNGLAILSLPTGIVMVIVGLFINDSN